MPWHAYLSFISELQYLRGNMDSIYTKLAVYGSKNLCARTDNVFPPISEICDGTVSLWVFEICHNMIFVSIWGFEFCQRLSFVTSWVFKILHNLSFWAGPQFNFLSLVIIWLFEICHYLSFVTFQVFEFLIFLNYFL